MHLQYFTSKNYEKHPVVGVSYQAAQYYCIWLTNKENQIRQEKRLPLIQNYRIPMEPEWQYAAQHANEKQLMTQNYPNPSQQGRKDQWLGFRIVRSYIHH